MSSSLFHYFVILKDTWQRKLLSQTVVKQEFCIICLPKYWHSNYTVLISFDLAMDSIICPQELYSRAVGDRQSKQTACQRLTHIDGGVGDDPAKVGEDVRREEVRVDLVPQTVGLPERMVGITLNRAWPFSFCLHSYSLIGEIADTGWRRA